jgi:hypothetical protein
MSDAFTICRQEDRLEVFCFLPCVFHQLIGRKVRISGLPEDAEYVKSWHDPMNDLFYLVYRHPSFEPIFHGVCPIPKSFIVTEYHDE